MQSLKNIEATWCLFINSRHWTWSVELYKEITL